MDLEVCSIWKQYDDTPLHYLSLIFVTIYLFSGFLLIFSKHSIEDVYSVFIIVVF